MRFPGARVGRAVPAALLLAFFVLPLVALVLTVPSSGLGAAARDPGFDAALGFTLLASALAVAGCLVLGVPLGHWLARSPARGKVAVESLAAVPIVVPHLIAGLALLLLFAPNAPLGALAIRAGVPIFDTIWGAVLVMVYVSAPYTVLASELAFRSVDARILETARTLGAGPATRFFTVTLPLAARGIAAGAILTWARAVGEIGGFLVLAYTIYPASLYAGPVTSPVSVWIYNLYEVGDLPGAAAAASVLVLLAFALFVAIRLGARLRVGARRWRMPAP